MRRATTSVRTAVKGARALSSKSYPLRERLVALIPQKRESLQQLQKDHGEKVLGSCTVSQAIGGMRRYTFL